MPGPSRGGLALRTPREIAKMRRAGLVVWQAHQAAARLIQPGVTTRELNGAIRATFAEHRAQPLFLNYPGPTPFPAESCISVNEELVHGIPKSRRLQEGDIVSIDTGCRLAGWCGDAAVTHPVGRISATARRLLDVTRAALQTAIDTIPQCRRWSEVARAIEGVISDAGFHVVDTMVGHGIGQNMHEAPSVPNYYSREWAAKDDFYLKSGLVIAVEPMVNVGTRKLTCLNDGWTQIAADKSLSAHFEHTLAITAEGVRRLTGPPTEEELELVPDWLRTPSQWIDW